MDKVRTVMKEFKRGDLKSSSGQKVTNPKQAIAIGLSEAGLSKKSQGRRNERVKGNGQEGSVVHEEERRSCIHDQT